MNSMYYDKNDQPIIGPDACMKWAKQFEDNSEGRIVRQQTTWLGFWVSTVWLGIDHNFGWGKPLIYETMIFRGAMCDIEMERYSTKKEAVVGHKQMFLKWSNPLRAILWLTENRRNRIGDWIRNWKTRYISDILCWIRIRFWLIRNRNRRAK